MDSGTSQQQQDVESSSRGVAGQGQQASTYEVTRCSSVVRLGNLGDERVVTNGLGFGKGCTHDFSTLLVFHD